MNISISGNRAVPIIQMGLQSTCTKKHNRRLGVGENFASLTVLEKEKRSSFLWGFCFAHQLFAERKRHNGWIRMSFLLNIKAAPREDRNKTVLLLLGILVFIVLVSSLVVLGFVFHMCWLIEWFMNVFLNQQVRSEETKIINNTASLQAITNYNVWFWVRVREWRN